MKLLLTAINSKFSHSSPVPEYLRNAAEGHVDEIEIAEYTVNQNLRDVINNIYDLRPDVAAFSVYVWNAEFTEKLIRDLKKIMPELTVICGGPEAGYNKDFQNRIIPFADYIVTGPGEGAFTLLAENSFHFGSKFISVKPLPVNDIPFPYKKEDFPHFENRFLYYESSRGCPFKCSYCLSSREDVKTEFRNIDKVKSELSIISENYHGTVKFIDRTFNASRKHSREIWSYLLCLNSGNTYHFEIYPELLEDADFVILKKFPEGRLRFEIGIQSVHEHTLSRINRKNDITLIRNNISRLISETRINIHLDLIAGLPGESLEDIYEGINFILDLEPHQFQLGFLKVLPGTRIYDQKEQYGIISSDSPPYCVYQTAGLSYDDIILLEKIESIIDSLYNSGQFKTVFSLLKSTGERWSEILKKLANFKDCFQTNTQGFSWSSYCSLLGEFILQVYPEQEKFFRDCARFDYFNNFYSSDYPLELKGEFTEKLKREMLLKIKDVYDVDSGLRGFVKKNEFGKLMYFRLENENTFISLKSDVCLLKIRRSGEIFEYSLLL